MTYGVALFIIVAVIAAIYGLLGNLPKPQLCQFTDVSLSCSEKTSVIETDGTSTTALISLTNRNGQEIVLKKIGCFNFGTGNLEKNMLTKNLSDTHLKVGQTKDFMINCVDSSGLDIPNSEGNYFTGSIGITYSFLNEVSGATDRLATASIASKVQAK